MQLCYIFHRFRPKTGKIWSIWKMGKLELLIDPIGYLISVIFSDLFRKVVLPSSTESDLFRQSSTTD